MPLAPRIALNNLTSDILSIKYSHLGLYTSSIMTDYLLL